MWIRSGRPDLGAGTHPELQRPRWGSEQASAQAGYRLVVFGGESGGGPKGLVFVW